MQPCKLLVSCLALLAIGLASGAPVSEAEIRPAVGKSVALLQQAGETWLSKQSCVSCHQQFLPLMVMSAARRRGVPLDQSLLEKQFTKGFGYMADLDRAVQGSYIIDPVMLDAYALVATAPLGMPKNLATRAYARLIARRQMDDGRWLVFDARPPQSVSEVTGTAVALRALQLYLPDSMAAERKMRVDRARVWLASVKPRDTEDRVSQLKGLFWAGSNAADCQKLGAQLAQLQRDDGGWSQLPGRLSDSYATGEVLVTLNLTGVMEVSSDAYQKGLRYLLKTQEPGGLWHMTSRVHPPAPLSPPYFESGLPFGHDQFITAMGTSWATMALLRALPEARTPAARLNLSALNPKDAPPWANTVLFGSTADLQILLDSGWDPNSATSKGTTALMMAAPDIEKVKLLIDNGAKVNAKASTKYTALMIAASHHATDSVRLLLDRGAEAQPPKGEPAFLGATPMFWAVAGGDIEAATALQKKGASVSPRMILGGVAPCTPLAMVSQQGNAKMVAALVGMGAAVDEMDADTGVTTLGWAVFKNDLEQARFLISKKADVNHIDKLGYTPLEWAANVNYGDSAMLELLLRSGAKTQPKTKEGLRALDLASKHGYTRHKTLLQAAR
jgi:ankyrin repeat protein